MQLDELEEKTSSDVTPTLRTGYVTCNLFFHRDSTSGTKPMPTNLEAHRATVLLDSDFKLLAVTKNPVTP